MIMRFIFLLSLMGLTPGPAGGGVANVDELIATDSTYALAQIPLIPDFLYNSIGPNPDHPRPLMVTISPLGNSEWVDLVLLDEMGEPQIPAASVRPGRIDLTETFPDLWKVRRTSYLQMFVDGSPVGSALVVQPMLSRMVPLVKWDQRSDGSPYQRIDGWRDELAPDTAEITYIPSENETAKGALFDDSPTGDEPTELEIEQPTPQNLMTAHRSDAICSGFRVYVEHDVMLNTNLGTMIVAMCPEEAPNTVWNFLELARDDYYRLLTFHRIVPLAGSPPHPFVIQAGDPTGLGDGGPGYWLPIEPSRFPHDFGVMSMARGDDPDSAGGQFFIALSREGTARLDGQYCAFAYIIDGAEIIQAIAAVDLADPALGQPVDPPLILSADLIPASPHEYHQSRWERRVSPVIAEEPEPELPARVPR